MLLKSTTALAWLHLVAALAVRVNEDGTAAGDITVTVFNTRWVDAARPITTTPATPTSINKATPIQTPVKTPAAGGAEPTLITAPGPHTAAGGDTSDNTSDDTSDLSTPTPDQSVPAVTAFTPSVTPSSKLSPATPVTAGATTPSKAKTTPAATIPSSAATAAAGTPTGAASGASDTGKSTGSESGADTDAPIPLTANNPPLIRAYPGTGVTINNFEEYDLASHKLLPSAEYKLAGTTYNFKSQLGLGQWPSNTATYSWHITYRDANSQKSYSSCTASRRAGNAPQQADVFLSFTGGADGTIAPWVMVPLGEISVKCEPVSAVVPPRAAPSTSTATASSTSISASTSTATASSTSLPLMNVYLGEGLTIKNFKAYDPVSQNNMAVAPFKASEAITHRAQIGLGTDSNFVWEAFYVTQAKTTINTICTVSLKDAVKQKININTFLFYHWPTRSLVRGTLDIDNVQHMSFECVDDKPTVLPAVYLVLGPGVTVKNFVGYDSTTGESGSPMSYKDTPMGGTYIKGQAGLGLQAEGTKSPPPIVWEIEYTVGVAVGVVGTVTTEICTVNRRVSSQPQKADAIFVIQAVAGDGHVPVTTDSAKEVTFSCKAKPT